MPTLLLYVECLPYYNLPILGPTEESDDCEWTDWQDNDNPSGTGDYENAPETCDIQKYQVQLVAGGTIYNDVADIGINNVQFSNPGGIYCKHDQQGGFGGTGTLNF